MQEKIETTSHLPSDYDGDRESKMVELDTRADMDMDIDSNDEQESESSESESDDETQDKEKETKVRTYLGKKVKKFVPYEFADDSNSLEMVIDKREQHDPDNAIKWYSSTRIKAFKLLNEKHIDAMEKIAPIYDKQFWIESAVAGGRCYRLLLGKTHPKMLSGEGNAFSEIADGHRIYRLSKEIPNFEIWLSIANQDIQQFLDHKPIFGMTAIHLISYFLGDIDLNKANFGLIEFADYWHAVKIDPECCFSHIFHRGSQAKIENYIKKLPQKVPENLFSMQELFETLGVIISTPLSSYEAIFDKSFSHNFGKQKEIYLAALARQKELYTEVAFSIQGFKEYYEERDPSCRYKKLEADFKSNQEQQVDNQARLEEFCEQIPQERPISHNRYGFYHPTETKAPECYVTPQEIFGIEGGG